MSAATVVPAVGGPAVKLSAVNARLYLSRLINYVQRALSIRGSHGNQGRDELQIGDLHVVSVAIL